MGSGEVLNSETSSSSSESSQESQPESSQDQNVEEEEQEEESTATGKYATIADYIASPALQETLSSLKEALQSSGINLDMKADGDRFIYEYTYSQDVGDLEAAAAALEESLASQASTFTNVANSLKLAVEVENPVVVVSYYNVDGTEIFSQEFTAEE